MDRKIIFENNYFLNALKENDNIEEGFRELVYSTLNGLYFGLGEKNFLRWINKYRISDRLKEFIVETFNEEDLNQHPNAAGFYTFGTNTVKLREDSIDENTNRHETLHFTTDFSLENEGERPNNFLLFSKIHCTFLNEGLTEYLNREIEKLLTGKKNIPYTYGDNVDFVEFLHNIMGDTLIKSYLAGRNPKFNQEFSSYITENGNEDLQVLQEFEKLLDDTHDFLYSKESKKKDKTPEEQQAYLKKKENIYDNVYPKLREYTSNIAVNYIRKKARSLEYIQDGKIDADALNADILNVVRLVHVFFSNGNNERFGFDISSEEYESYITNIMEQVTKTAFSELSIEIPESESYVVKGQKNGQKQLNLAKEKTKKKTEEFSGIELYKLLISDRSGQDEKSKYIKDGKFDITHFFMNISLILEKFNFDEKTKGKAIDYALERLLPDDINRDFARNMFNEYSEIFSVLNILEQEDKNGVVDTKLAKISDDCYLAKRDSAMVIVNVDKKKKRVLARVGSLDRDFHKEKLLNTGDKKEKIICFKTQPGPYMHKAHSIVCNPDFSDVIVDNKSAVVIEGYSRLGESLLAEEALKEVTSDVRKYSTRLNENKGPKLPEVFILGDAPVNSETEILNFRKIRQDIEKATEFLPKEQSESVLYCALSRILQQIYHAELEDFPEFVDIIKNQNVLINPPDQKWLQKVYEFSERVNTHKRSLKPKKNSGYAFYYQTEDEKRKVDKYFIDVEKYEKRKRFRDEVESFGVEYIDACIVEASPYRKSSDNYIAIEGVNYLDRILLKNNRYESGHAKKVDYERFCSAIKEELDNIPEEDRKRFVEQVSSNAISYWYGGTSELESGEDDPYWKFYEFAYDMIKGAVFEDQQLDIELIEKKEQEYLMAVEESIKKCEENIKSHKLTPRFEYPESQVTYEAIEEIENDETIDEDDKKKTIEILKKQNDARITKKKKMSMFAKLALSGENVPSENDVRQATLLLGYKETEKNVEEVKS